MDNEAKKKYCRLLMFDIPSTDSSQTATSPSASRSLADLPTPACKNPKSVLRKQRGTGPSSIMGAPYPRAATSGSVLRHSVTKKASEEVRTPRPPNAFILYRRAVQPSIIAARRNISNAEISQQLSRMWKDEPESVKLQWQREADRKKMEHAEAHPDYVYRPKKPAVKGGKKAAAAGKKAGKAEVVTVKEEQQEQVSIKLDNDAEYPLLNSLELLMQQQQALSPTFSPVSPMTPSYYTAYSTFHAPSLAARSMNTCWGSFPAATDSMYTFNNLQLQSLDSSCHDAQYLPTSAQYDMTQEDFGKAFPDFVSTTSCTQEMHAYNGDSLASHLFSTFNTEEMESYARLLASESASFEQLD